MIDEDHTEQHEIDCLNSLHGRQIKSIYFTNSDTELIIETHDQLRFVVGAGCAGVSYEAVLFIKQTEFNNG
jgi:hypothetical protein